MTSATAIPARRWNLFSIGLLLLLLSAVLYRTSLTVADPDLWGHVRFGQDILRDGRIAQQDPYSYLSGDQPWINHEWLAEVISALAYSFAGSVGLVVFKTSVSLIMAGLLLWHLIRNGMNILRAGILLILTIFLMLPGLQSIRPQLFTYLFFQCVMLIIHGVEHGHRRLLWLLPPVFALWINCHGGVLAGVGVLALWLFARLIRSVLPRWPGLSLRSPLWPASERPPTAILVAVAVAASIVASFVNPYHVRLWEFLLRTATIPRPDISEWQALKLVSLEGVAYAVAVLVAVAGILASRRSRHPVLLFLLLCIAALPLVAVRHLQLFALTMPILAGEHIADAWNRWLDRDNAPRSLSPKSMDSVAGIVVSVIACGLVVMSVPHFRCIHMGPQVGFPYPVRAVALLKEAGAKGNLAIDFDWGEYVIWHLGPDVKVSVDGRRETVYSEEVYAETFRFTRGAGSWSDLLEKRDTQMVLVRRIDAVFNLMRLKSGWTLAYDDSLCGLFIRQGSPFISRLQQARTADTPFDGMNMCFP